MADVVERTPSNADAMANAEQRKSVANKGLTGASALTVRQSIWPITLVTILFFLWGFAYGLLDVLNAKFQNSLNITAAKAGGLQGSYFGAYFIGPLTYSGWFVRKFGYRWFVHPSMQTRVQLLTCLKDIHLWPLHLRCWRVDVLAFSCLQIIPRLLRLAFHCWIRSLHPRDFCQPLHRHLRTA